MWRTWNATSAGVDVIEFLELADAIGFDPTAVLQQVKSVDEKVRRPDETGCEQ